MAQCTIPALKMAALWLLGPLRGNSIFGAWHLPIQPWLTEQNVKTKVIGLLQCTQWSKSQESVAFCLPVLQNVMSSTDLHRFGCEVLFTASGDPILSASLNASCNLDTVGPHRQDCTAQNVDLAKKTNPVLIATLLSARLNTYTLLPGEVTDL